MIRYRRTSTYKYQLVEDYAHPTGWSIDTEIVSPGGWVELRAGGELLIRRGYCWDGASGPTIDTKSSMRGSLVHDAICQLIREGVLSPAWLYAGHYLFWRICLQDGMWAWRARLYYKAVRRFGARYAKPGSQEVEVLTAP